jgi:hypothetical protein
MPYADPEVKKQKEKEYRSRPDVMERNREMYRKRYATNETGTADKVRAKHHDRWRDPEYQKQKQIQYQRRWEKDWAGQKIIQLRAKAKKYNIDFDIDASDIHLPEKCPIFGIVLRKSTGRLSNCSPSVDRVDASKGYVKGNVVVVSNKANSIKREATISDLRKMVAFYESLTKGTENE